MKFLQKSISLVLIATILSVFQFSFSWPVAKAGPSIIYKTSTKENITSGVTRENIKRFTVDGWQNINVLRVNLSNSYIKVDTMSNSNSIMSLSTVKSLAQSRKAVAAVNGGFFTGRTRRVRPIHWVPVFNREKQPQPQLIKTRIRKLLQLLQ
jgi:hypothetical protein